MYGMGPKTMHRNAVTWLVSNQPNLRKITLNRPLLIAETSSQIMSLELILFGNNFLSQVVLKRTMTLKEPLFAWGNNLTFEEMLEHQNVSTNQHAYWCLTIIYMSSDDVSF